MIDKNIETIIVKYFSKSASIDELMVLTEWLNEASNNTIFKEFVKTNYLADVNVIDFDTELEKKKILYKIREQERRIRKRRLMKAFRYAAVLVIAVGVGSFYMVRNFKVKEESKPVITANEGADILPGSDKAILTLENGSNIALESGVEVNLDGRTLDKEKLVYHSKVNEKNTTIQYNYLTIPKGGRFFVQLSDGTNVWLNSESKLKYPVSFVQGQPRMVELIYGEAYFDVSKSTSHGGDAFVVNTKNQEIEVLGTEFNIKAYQDEDTIVTTLVEGKVKVDNGVEHKLLNPSEQSLVNVDNQTISVRKVDKVFDEIAWKEGYFSFKRMSMKDIMKTLSRWYNITYTFNSPDTEKKSFTGVLDREVSIDQVLIYIQKTNEFKYSIKENTIIIE
ncbi:FecR family protein [Snuella sedimenti]|uniref:DUF4974 domain-containing protein n=1 Tax=Snuella sedimenti TaxID=2798802 RepID=A0A8J7LP42_9FLAO|nr:FecR family protein [Snuella sedimenti]MBJ6368788.1 DUF4974 domain-containing protein [Snuella sedimenti]